MSIIKNLSYSCLIVQLLSCGTHTGGKTIQEKDLCEQDLSVLQSDLRRQETAMESILTQEEIELAQQIILKQQLMDLEAKMAGEETRLASDLVSNSLKEAQNRP